MHTTLSCLLMSFHYNICVTTTESSTAVMWMYIQRIPKLTGAFSFSMGKEFLPFVQFNYGD